MPAGRALRSGDEPPATRGRPNANDAAIDDLMRFSRRGGLLASVMVGPASCAVPSRQSHGWRSPAGWKSSIGFRRRPQTDLLAAGPGHDLVAEVHIAAFKPFELRWQCLRRRSGCHSSHQAQACGRRARPRCGACRTTHRHTGTPCGFTGDAIRGPVAHRLSSPTPAGGVRSSRPAGSSPGLRWR
jgi:hypothetical protein